MAFLNQTKTAPVIEARPRLDTPPAAVTTLGRDLIITGDIVCSGTVNVFGRVIGDIRALSLTIGEGGWVEGTIKAADVVVRGAFKGTLIGGNVKIQGTGRVEGEVHNKTLSIEENAMFDGVARRLERSATVPNQDEFDGMPKAAVLPRVEADTLALSPDHIIAEPSGIDEEVLA